MSKGKIFFQYDARTELKNMDDESVPVTDVGPAMFSSEQVAALDLDTWHVLQNYEMLDLVFISIY